MLERELESLRDEAAEVLVDAMRTVQLLAGDDATAILVLALPEGNRIWCAEGYRAGEAVYIAHVLAETLDAITEQPRIRRVPQGDEEF
jgi:hypothetical protein